MKYDFTSIIDRVGKDAVALAKAPSMAQGGILPGFDIIPMWIADMNFATCPTITKAMKERIDHPLFGYFPTRDEYYDLTIQWQEKRNQVTGLTKECIGYENGVLGGVASALEVLCLKGEAVLVHSPTYVGFTGVLTNAGYKVVHSELVKDECGTWRMDFEDMEKKIVSENIHTAIFCSPHNPCGRVWEKWEIEKFMELCKKYDVYVISDEIWSDIIRPDKKHIPTQSVSEDARNRTMAFYAISKTFSTAGLVGSYHIVYNKYLRDKLNRVSSLGHYNSMNVLSMWAQIGAYQPEGYEWVDEMNQVIAGNVDFACDYIEKHFDGVKVFKPEGTYMLFIDCAGWLEKHGKTLDELLQLGYKYGVIWQNGARFFGMTSIRMNLALPLTRVQEAFERLDKYVFNAD